ncbi:MAG: hypothetical protein HYX32_00810 [Actinobacteria bacterium]|nr:hypothetical protein [Actinomycetota bacterium]
MAAFAIATAACAGSGATPPSTSAAPPTTRPLALKVLVAGDSQAYSLALSGMFGQGALKVGIVPRAAALLGCGVAQGDGRYVDGTPFTPNVECQTWPELWKANYEEVNPDISIIQIGAWEVYDRIVDGRDLRVGTPEWQQYTLGQLQQGIDILAAAARPVVLLLMPCYDGPVDLGGPPVAGSDLGRVGWVNEMLKQAGARNPTTTTVVDLGALLCPDGKRIVTMEGVQVTDAEQVHFGNDGARIVWAWLEPRLRQIVASQRPG